MAVTAGVVLYGPDGRTLVSAANPLAMSPTINGSPVSGANPLSVVPGVIAPSSSNSGTAAAPGAGSAFVSIGAITIGWYRVAILYTITGAVETQAKNVRLSFTTGGSLVDFPSGAGVAAVYSFVIEAVVNLNAGDTIKLTAIAAATAATVYTGTISLYRIA